MNTKKEEDDSSENEEEDHEGHYHLNKASFTLEGQNLALGEELDDEEEEEEV